MIQDHKIHAAAGRAVILSMALAIFGSSEAPAQERAAPAEPPPVVTILQTRSWSPDGKVPTGTIWRGFQTWRTDVARTEKGELVAVDPMTPRVGRSAKGELIRYYCNQPGWALPQKLVSVEVFPAKQVHGSAWPPANWQAPDFDDSTWIRDPYPQRELYGLVALRCLRGKFDVPDPARAKELSLTLRFRGGAVAYLNGKEVTRAAMPSGAVTYETSASSSHEATLPETFVLGVASDLLVEGRNVLAIEGHNVDLGSSDLTLTPALRMPPATGYSGQTYYVTTMMVTITGHTSGSGATTVTVDGELVDFDPVTGVWTTTVALMPGQNSIAAHAFNAGGTEVDYGDIKIVYVAVTKDPPPATEENRIGGELKQDTTLSADFAFFDS